MSTTMNPTPEQEIAALELAARRTRAEASKLEAEASKLEAERHKLDAEKRKLNRDLSWAWLLTGAALAVTSTVLAGFVLHLLGAK